MQALLLDQKYSAALPGLAKASEQARNAKSFDLTFMSAPRRIRRFFLW
jgi:hypothetical protein